MAGEYHSLKKQHYLALIKECAHSGKTNREWCSENGIAYSSFMRWQALLRDEAAGKVMEQQAIVPVKIAPPAPVNTVFQPMNRTRRFASRKMECQFPCQALCLLRTFWKL